MCLSLTFGPEGSGNPQSTSAVEIEAQSFTTTTATDPIFNLNWDPNLFTNLGLPPPGDVEILQGEDTFVSSGHDFDLASFLEPSLINGFSSHRPDAARSLSQEDEDYILALLRSDDTNPGQVGTEPQASISEDKNAVYIPPDPLDGLQEPMSSPDNGLPRLPQPPSSSPLSSPTMAVAHARKRPQNEAELTEDAEQPTKRIRNQSQRKMGKTYMVRPLFLCSFSCLTHCQLRIQLFALMNEPRSSRVS